MIGGPVGKDYCELNAMSNDIFEEDEFNEEQKAAFLDRVTGHGTSQQSASFIAA